MTQPDTSSLSRDAQPRRTGFAAFARRVAFAAPLAVLLASCGGGVGVDVGDGGGSSLTCSVPDQETWLADYFASDYLWNSASPAFPAQTADVPTFFNSLLYTGGDPDFPVGVTDIWSSFTTDDAFNRVYVDGQDLGYGVFVNGIEAQASGQTLTVRYVDPNSPAAAQGVMRGDVVTAINGVPAATVVASNDYSGLSSTVAGQTLTLDTQNAAGAHHLTLASAVYTLAPVPTTRVFTSPGGRAIGYVLVTDTIDQALSPYDAAFTQFKAAGVQDVVIDVRYNSAGTVGDGEILASYPAGPATDGQVYANLYFNDSVAAVDDSYYTFDHYDNALGLSRVYVLTGPRTCGVAEQIVNGLSPFVQVVTVGDATCGKPVGATPVSNCGTTYSAMTFQVTNNNNDGQYFDGLPPTCQASENLSTAIGADNDPLLVTAAAHADSGTCSATPLNTPKHVVTAGAGHSHWLEPNDRH